MDKIVESRMNRSLLIHGLENLVFEKRQRKTLQPVPNTLSIYSHQKNVANKKQKTVINKQTGQKIKTIKRKVNKYKYSGKIEQSKLRRQKQAQQRVYSSDDSKEISQIQEKASSEKISEKCTKKSSPTKRKNVTQMKKPIQISAKSNIKFEEQQIDKQKDNQADENMLIKRGRGRPKKGYVESLNDLSGQKIMNQQNIQAQSDLIAKGIDQILPEISIKLQKKSDNVNEQNKYLIIATEKINPRQRRAKVNINKSYNENEDQNDSQQSYINQKSYKRKKKISKSNRTKANNKPYSLNRIFRKQAKRHFATFALNVDLNKIAFSQLIKQFGTFDLIHFSLPISYLNIFSQIINLIQKGFIFVWAQKGETQIGYHLLNRWGFDVIDQIIWIKSNQEQSKIEADNVDICNLITDSIQENTRYSKQLFLNSKSTCLVGYKCPVGNKAEYRTKVSNNIIFAKSMQGLNKPAQIYQIADLMMPGAKKLQFGNDPQKGWLNLKHHQNTIYRCNICVRQQNLYFLVQETYRPVQCKKCIIDNIRNDYQIYSKKDISARYQEIIKVQIKNVVYRDHKMGSCCQKCQKQYESLTIQGLFIVGQAQSLACIDCFRQISRTQELKQSTILLEKMQIYQENQLTCSDCGVLSICDIYFQCNKCKNHVICKNCFWKCKSQDETHDQVQQENKKSAKKNLIHEWRLKFVKNYPLMKFTCFGCKDLLSIPFWCCQTCQNWFWCGRCDKGNSENHPHYQTNEHKQYLMI